MNYQGQAKKFQNNRFRRGQMLSWRWKFLLFFLRLEGFCRNKIFQKWFLETRQVRKSAALFFASTVKKKERKQFYFSRKKTVSCDTKPRMSELVFRVCDLPLWILEKILDGLSGSLQNRQLAVSGSNLLKIMEQGLLLGKGFWSVDGNSIVFKHKAVRVIDEAQSAEVTLQILDFPNSNPHLPGRSCILQLSSRSCCQNGGISGST